MNIMVTGGAGFIGSTVADAFIEAGHNVVVVDDLSAGNEGNINKKARFYREDIRSGAVKEIIKNEKIDIIDHHAAQISVPDSVKAPGKDAGINILGTLNLLEGARENGVKKFIFISSGGTVYGAPEKFPVSENAPYAPETPYGISKTAGEFYVKFYAAQYGFKYTILRYSNVYGPRQVPHGEAGVVSIFIEKILKDDVPVIFGKGSCVRDYLYAGDAAKANVLALSGGDNDEFNIGTGIPTDVNGLFSVIKKVTGFKGTAESGPFRDGDIKENYLDAGKAGEKLMWRAEVPLEEGIKKTYRYFKEKI